jgi:hypothetical protein
MPEVDTSLWDPGSIDIRGVMDIVMHTGQRVVKYDVVVCSGVQCVFGAFPPGSPSDKGIKHTLGFDLPMIDECMDELHGSVYSLKIDL